MANIISRWDTASQGSCVAQNRDVDPLSRQSLYFVLRTVMVQICIGSVCTTKHILINTTTSGSIVLSEGASTSRVVRCAPKREEKNRATNSGTALTGLVGLEQLLRLVPHGLAVLLEFEEARLLPGAGANLEQVSPFEQELEVRVTLHT